MKINWLGVKLAVLQKFYSFTVGECGRKWENKKATPEGGPALGKRPTILRAILLR